MDESPKNDPPAEGNEQTPISPGAEDQAEPITQVKVTVDDTVNEPNVNDADPALDAAKSTAQHSNEPNTSESGQGEGAVVEESVDATKTEELEGAVPAEQETNISNTDGASDATKESGDTDSVDLEADVSLDTEAPNSENVMPQEAQEVPVTPQDDEVEIDLSLDSKATDSATLETPPPVTETETPEAPAAANQPPMPPAPEPSEVIGAQTNQEQPIAAHIPEVLSVNTANAEFPQASELPNVTEPIVTSAAVPSPTANEVPGVTTAPTQQTAIQPENHHSALNRWLVIALAGFGVLLLALGLLYAFVFRTTALSPEQAFAQFPLNALQTQTVKKDFLLKTEEAQLAGTAVMDYSDPQKVTSSIDYVLDVTYVIDLKYDQSIITTDSTTFSKINEFRADGVDELNQSIVDSLDDIKKLEGQWIAISETDDEDTKRLVTGEASAVAEELNSMFGEVPTALLTENQLSSVESFLAENTVYTYDGEPTTETINSQEAYRYDAKIDTDKLRAYNTMLADLTSIDMPATAEDLSESASVSIWIAKKDARLLKIAYTTTDGNESTMSYTEHNNAIEIVAPADTIDVEQAFQVYAGNAVLDATDQAESPDGDEANLQEDTTVGDEEVGAVQKTDSDTQRKADIDLLHDELQNFYDEVGHYPTVASYSDETWIATNMPAITVEDQTDPSGDRYTYITTTPNCDNVSIDCEGFLVAADLKEDGRGINDSDNNQADYVLPPL